MLIVPAPMRENMPPPARLFIDGTASPRQATGMGRFPIIAATIAVALPVTGFASEPRSQRTPTPQTQSVCPDRDQQQSQRPAQSRKDDKRRWRRYILM